MEPHSLISSQLAPSRLARIDPAEDKAGADRGNPDDLEIDAALALACPGHRLGNAETERQREIEVPLRQVTPDRADQRGDRESDGGRLCQVRPKSCGRSASPGHRRSRDSASPTGVRTPQRGQIGLPHREQRSRVITLG